MNNILKHQNFYRYQSKKRKVSMQTKRYCPQNCYRYMKIDITSMIDIYGIDHVHLGLSRCTCTWIDSQR